jgi:hypothetical protein
MAEIDITLQAANTLVGAAPTEGQDDEVATTTAYQLKVDQLTHSFKEGGIPIGLPTTGESLDQLRQLVVTIGERTEEIRFSGTLVDRGIESASNPRKQTLLQIARRQWARIIGVRVSGVPLGGSAADVANPNSYPLLTIGSGKDADGTSDRAYRILIRDITFTQVGGQPDRWKFNVTCSVIMNEKDF